jgi:gluconate kinase
VAHHSHGIGQSPVLALNLRDAFHNRLRQMQSRGHVLFLQTQKDASVNALVKAHFMRFRLWQTQDLKALDKVGLS